LKLPSTVLRSAANGCQINFHTPGYFAPGKEQPPNLDPETWGLGNRELGTDNWDLNLGSWGLGLGPFWLQNQINPVCYFIMQRQRHSHHHQLQQQTKGCCSSNTSSILQ